MPDPKDNCIRVDPLRPDDASMQKAGEILSQDGVVIFPAACLYGVAANALSPEAVEKVFSLKQRPKDNPILVLIRNRAMLEQLVKTVPPEAERLMKAFWPGSLTLVFEAAGHISPILTAGTGKIGIRMPGHPVARALARAVDFPITGTSANLSGSPGAARAEDLPPSIRAAADLVLDAGPVNGGTGSTIADLTHTPIKIIREGAVPAREIFATLA